MSTAVPADLRSLPDLPFGFAPELRFLLALVRAGLGTGPVPASPLDVAWPTFVPLVERHRLAPFLHRHAAAAVSATVPPAVAQRLAGLATQHTRRALALAADQFRFVEALAAARIETLAVKGLVLSQQLHGGPGGRFIGDIDLVVRRADVARADAVLQAAGLRRSHPDFNLTPRQFQEYLRLKTEFEYARKQPPLRVELLWRLEGLPAVESLWSRAIAIAVASRTLRTVPAEFNALYLFQHGARHGWFRLFWLIDIARLMQTDAIDWSTVLAQARVTGGHRALLQGAALASDLLGITPPPALTSTGHARGVLRGLIAEARRQLVRPADRETTVEWFRKAAYRVRLQDTARAKLAAAAPHLSSPLNWQTWPLPDRWFWLYRFASPVLWLCRRARRRVPHS